MKLFRVKVTVPKSKVSRAVQDYVDWYEADTLEQAKADHDEDLHRYGLPSDSLVEIVECDPITLKPITNIKQKETK